MNKKEKQNIISAWNEIEEANCSLSTIPFDSLKQCLPDIQKRLSRAMLSLDQYFSDEEAIDLT